MTDAASARAVELLIGEAWTTHTERRYPASLAAAERAVRAAEELGDVGLLLRALEAEADGLDAIDDSLAALARYTRMLGLAEDPASQLDLDNTLVTNAVAWAHIAWVKCSREVSGVEVRRLFAVLDAGERRLAAMDARRWLSTLLVERADLHNWLEEVDQAVAVAQEALAVHQSGGDKGGPGYSLAVCQRTLADFLCKVDRRDEAMSLYQAVLDDPDVWPVHRARALAGLADCALKAGDHAAAHRHATAAVRLADTLGGGVQRVCVTALITVCRGTGDLVAARQAADRGLELVQRLSTRIYRYHALRDLIDVALDQRDLATVDRHLPELAAHATALDADAGDTVAADKVAERRARRAELDADGDGPS